jgi:hypothetical protein
VDRVAKITSNPTWPTLAANTTTYGFIEDTDGTPTYSISTLAPSYGMTRPASPAAGQFHYDIRHRGGAVVWDGTAWVERRIICVWEAVTGASTVTTLRSYAILGRYDSPVIPGSQLRQDILSHNLGVPPLLILANCYLIAQVDTIGYVAGDVMPYHMSSQTASPDSISSRGMVEVFETRNTLLVRQANINDWFFRNKTGTATSTVSSSPRSNWSIFYQLRRAF